MNPPGTDTGRSALPAAEEDRLPILLCLSHLRWDFVYQRPQHLLTRAAATYEVIFFEEPIFDDSPSARMDQSLEPGGVLRVLPFIPHGTSLEDTEAQLRRFVDALVAERGAGSEERPLHLWYYTPMALAFSGHLTPQLVIYDCMDELSAFRGAPPRLTELEAELFARADLVFTGGQRLFEAKRGRHPNVHCFPSSIDTAHFGQARSGQGAEPADQAGIPHPRLGFFGVVDERMDIDLLAELAALRPDWHFVMIGPVVKIDEADLPREANIHWLGGKSYPELPAYLAGWDIGIMPFAMNESTRFISPTKTPEFLAAGLPVVSTPVFDVVRGYGDAGLVEIAASAAETVAAVEMLLARPREEWLKTVDARLAQTSWDRTWGGMLQSIRDMARRKAPPHPGCAAPILGSADHRQCMIG